LPHLNKAVPERQNAQASRYDAGKYQAQGEAPNSLACYAAINRVRGHQFISREKDL
jgi:hypothetical protein